MKCPEAVEWMHRYLDHDLNEEETSLLFEHIRGCEECAETFALLNKLSAQLEELPKVVPNFSLVDAILPQLDEIDRARREGGSAAEETVLPITAMPVDAGSGLSGTMLSRHSSRRQDADTGLRRSRIYRYGSLGVAAALILGVFIYQYEPRTASDAEIAMNSALSSDSVSEESSTADSAGDAAGNAQLFKDDSHTGGPEAGKADVPVPKEEGTPAEGLNSGGADSKIDTGGSPDNGTPAETRSKPEADTKAPSGSNSGKNDPAGNHSVPTDGDGGAPVQDSALPEARNMEPPADMTAPNDSEDDAINRQLTLDEPTGKLGIANMNTWTSSDGKFEAELKDGHLYVYLLEVQERKQVADQVIDGNWVDGAWSDEGHVFTYETEIDGTSAVHTVDAEKAAAASEETQP
ncbi:anti-sigma factor family protein [Paenibacillus phocaensis]|uniref:anti-sigma factor family protein n=1 Tax=Paenibacillus phocaensis TaxID=1776378 RepID=UPI000839BD50|nr:zf-HC2 domain-containing protein [Paenibacillus phocaensis]